MKRIFLAVLLSVFFCSALSAQEAKKAPEVPRIPAVTASEPYVAPALSDPDNWIMAVIPDTQTYSKFSRNHGIMDMMFTWIVENSQALRIQQAVFLGDLVDCNRRMLVNDKNHYLTGPEQWNAFSRITARFDGKLPYILATGNHDHGYSSAEDRYSELSRYFHPERNSKWRNCLVDMGPSGDGTPNLENAAYIFTTPNGQKVLIVSLAFAPTDKQIDWAKGIFNRKEYKDAFGILINHAYLRNMMDKRGQGPSTPLNSPSYRIEKHDGGNVGEDIWNKLVKVTPNVRMVLCGHISAADDWRGCLGHRISTNAGGKVHEILFDPQALAGGWSGNGGDGWIRLMEFSKDMKTVKVRTFSPYFAISPAVRRFAWHTHPANQFTLEY